MEFEIIEISCRCSSPSKTKKVSYTFSCKGWVPLLVERVDSEIIDDGRVRKISMDRVGRRVYFGWGGKCKLFCTVGVGRGVKKQRSRGLGAANEGWKSFQAEERSGALWRQLG